MNFSSIAEKCLIRYTYLRIFLFSSMTSKILKSTERGQITLPKQWRNQFSTGNYVVEMHDDKMIITPLNIEKKDPLEEILFDADRDNGGKGIGTNDIIRMLKEIQHG